MDPTPLATAFLGAGPVQIEPAAPAIEERIRAMHAAGQAAWPGVAVDPIGFARHLGRLALAAKAQDAHAWLLQRAPGDGLYLACACAAGDSAALASFESKYMSHLPVFVASFKFAPDRLDDLRQRLRQRLFVAASGDEAKGPKIGEYAGEGPLAGWMHIVARRMAITMNREQKPEDPVPEPSPSPILTDDPELELIKREHRRVFEQAVRDALALIPPESRTLLRLSYLERVGIDKLAAMFDIHRATAARRVEAAGNRLRAETLRLLKERLDLNDDGLASFIGALTNLHLSIAGAFKAEAPAEPA